MKKLFLVLGLAAFSLGSTTIMAAPHHQGYKKAPSSYHMKKAKQAKYRHMKAKKMRAMKARKARMARHQRHHRHY